MMYWQVDVKLEFTNDRGKVQKITEKYMKQVMSKLTLFIIGLNTTPMIV